ncbi:MAG: hypothetical protein JRN15_20035 [Nitrososphaerota archaeon]|nr:hypothetical protein [Nitrososphaerota archaeon]
MQTYIKTLEMQNLLVEVDDDGKRLYHLTQKGFETLSRFICLRDDLHLDLE